MLIPRSVVRPPPRNLVTTANVNCWTRNSLAAVAVACGGLTKKSDEWCEGVCYAWSESLCCDIDGGKLAGVIIGCIIALVLLIMLCCKACKCCCFKPKVEVQAVAIMAMPASVQVQPAYAQQSPHALK